MDRTSKLVIRRILVDFLCVFLVGITVLSFFLFGSPYKRGFFCNDESILYPWNKKSTVTSVMLYTIGLSLPIVAMILGEYTRKRNLSGIPSLVIGEFAIPYWLVMAYSRVGMFLFGAAVTVMTTDVAKYTIGRLRPHFIQLCNPSIDCSHPDNQHRYIKSDEFFCKGDASPKEQKESRLSFPSGHSSFAAFTMIFLALYIQTRLTSKSSRLLRHFLQFICIWMAWFTAMTRISDFKHHWSDVVVGLAIGTTVALVMAFVIADLFERRKSLSESIHVTEMEKGNRDMQCVENSPRPVVQGVRHGNQQNH